MWNTHQLQIPGNENDVDATSAHLVYHQEDVYYVSANNEEQSFIKTQVRLESCHYDL